MQVDTRRRENFYYQKTPDLMSGVLLDDYCSSGLWQSHQSSQTNSPTAALARRSLIVATSLAGGIITSAPKSSFSGQLAGRATCFST